MTPNPRCRWRAFVVLVLSLMAAIALTSAMPAAARAAAAAAAAAASNRSAAATSQPTTREAAAAAAASPAPPASASTVADDGADWSASVNRLATLLAGHDLPALQRALRPSPVIRPFSSDALQTHERLLGATTGSTVLGVHAYNKPPTTLATDLANDFANAGDVVPQSVRDGMVPPDEAAARRANETAGQWLVQVLQPDTHEMTGIIVLWPRIHARALAAQVRRATFVLVKGELVDGQYVYRQITFGDPLETPQ